MCKHKSFIITPKFKQQQDHVTGDALVMPSVEGLKQMPANVMLNTSRGTSKYKQIQANSKQMQANASKCKQMQANVSKCKQMQAKASKCNQMQAKVSKCNKM